MNLRPQTAASAALEMNRQKFFEFLSTMSQRDRESIQIAYQLAKDGHRKQLRDGGERYFEHVRRVAVLLVRRGVQPATAFIKALLHDALEDTFIPKTLIVRSFGIRTWNSLKTLSKAIPVFDPLTGKMIERRKKNLAEYFAGIAAAPLEDRRVKLADRLDNLRTMGAWPLARRQKYARETIQYILPIADATDPWFAAEIRAELKKIPMD